MSPVQIDCRGKHTSSDLIFVKYDSKNDLIDINYLLYNKLNSKLIFGLPYIYHDGLPIYQDCFQIFSIFIGIFHNSILYI